MTTRHTSASVLGRAVEAVSGWSARHSRAVLAGWLLFVVGCLLAGSLTGVRSLDGSDGIGESGRATTQVDRAGLARPATETIMLRSPDRAALGAAAGDLSARLKHTAGVSHVRTPDSDPRMRERGGRALLVQATLDGDPDTADERVGPVVAAAAKTAARHPAVTFDEAGDGTLAHGLNELVAQDLRRAEIYSLPLTLAILLFAFGALVAAAVPLLLGVTSAAAALGLLGPISQLVPVHDSASALVVLIGLAVGVDYSLFCIRRERAERAAGATPRDALETTMATVGRAVVIAGSTVVLALAGLLVSGLPMFASMAIGTIVVVAIAVLGSLTALPAALALLGDRVDRGRVPGLGRRSTPAQVAARAGGGAAGAAWGRLAARATERPRLALVLGAGVLAAVALPALSMRTADLQVEALPDSMAAVRAERAIERHFPGAPASAELVVTGSDLGTADARRALVEAGERARDATGGEGAIAVRVAADGRTAVLDVPAPVVEAERAGHVVDGLRREAPGLASQIGTDSEILVGGMQAEGVDFSDRMATATPFVIAVVLTLALVFLMVSFRSVALALAVIALNLLSVAAAYGILTLVFQHTWAESLLGFVSTGTVSNWVPLFLFVILFGLSMDYTILVLERIRELRGAGLSPRRAAARGVATTAGAVTSAAAVMVGVFALFAVMRFPDNKQLGVGLASAILLDATLIRGVLLPAAVTLVGERWRVPVRRRGEAGAGREAVAA